MPLFISEGIISDSVDEEWTSALSVLHSTVSRVPWTFQVLLLAALQGCRGLQQSTGTILPPKATSSLSRIDKQQWLPEDRSRLRLFLQPQGAVPGIFPNATEKESTAEKGGHQPVLGYWCLGLAAGLRAKWPRTGGYRRLVSRLQKHHCFQKGGEDVQSRLHHLPWRALHSGEFSPTLFIKVYLPCRCLLLMKWSHGLPSLSVSRMKSFENVILKQKP